MGTSCSTGNEIETNPTWAFFNPPERISDGNWELTFEDNFDELDLGKYETQYIWSRDEIINNEEQYYIDPELHGASPFEIEQGILKIKAQRTPANLRQTTTQEYVSGVLTSREEFSQFYGRFEVRAKMPEGDGLWPAFWLLPTHDRWPEGVAVLPELDVMEFISQEQSWYHTTIHSNVTGQSESVGNAISAGTNLSADFHDYAAVWGPEKIAWYFDGLKVFETDTPQDFNHPKHFLLNLAIGGSWAGSPSNNTMFPASFEIDHVKVYQFSDVAPDEGGGRLDTPTNLHNIVYSENTAELFWDRTAGHPPDVVFDVYKNFEYHASTSGRSFFLEGTVPGSTNRYHVVAKAPSFTSSFPAMTLVQNLGNIPTNQESLEAPTELEGVEISEQGILLRWQGSTSVNAAHYELWRGDSLIKLTDQTLFLDEDISRGSSYSYQVFVVSESGLRSASSNIWSTHIPLN